MFPGGAVEAKGLDGVEVLDRFGLGEVVLGAAALELFEGGLLGGEIAECGFVGLVGGEPETVAEGGGVGGVVS